MGVTPVHPGRAEAALYAAGSFGTGVFSAVPSLLLLYFCTEILRISPAVAAAIVFAPKAWSIVWDPLVGAWSDRTSSSLGRRRPFLIAGAIGVALAFVAVFSPPVLGRGALAAWVACAYFLLATLYSLFAVPYVAIPAEVEAPAAIRARLVSWRMSVAMIGILTGAGLVPLLVEASGGGRIGYARMSLWVAAACALAMTCPVYMMRHRDRPAARGIDGARQAILGNLWSSVSDHTFVRLVCAYLLQLTAVGIFSAATPYLVTQAFGRSDGDIGTAMLAMLACTTLSIHGWSRAGQRFGNARVLALSVVMYAAWTVCIGLLAWNAAPWPAALASFALLGIPFAAMQVLPYTMVAHLVHERTRGGHAAEGSFTGVWTATEKLGLALGPAFTGLVLAASGGHATVALPAFTAFGPAVLNLLSLPLILSMTAAVLPRASEIRP